MKKIIYTLIAVCIIFLISCKPSREKAIKYNDDIITEQVAVVKKIDDLDESVNNFDADKIEAAPAALKYELDIPIEKNQAPIDSTDGRNRLMNNDDADNIDAAFIALNKQLDISIKKIQNLKDFNGKHDFKEVTIKYFNTVREGMSAEMKPIIEILKKPLDEFTADDQKQIDLLFDKNIDRVQKVDNEFATIQEKFAKEYKFTLKENTFQKTSY
jgi:hypothetical protein